MLVMVRVFAGGTCNIVGFPMMWLLAHCHKTLCTHETMVSDKKNLTSCTGGCCFHLIFKKMTQHAVIYFQGFSDSVVTSNYTVAQNI